MLCSNSGKAANTNDIVFDLIRPWLKSTIYWTQSEHADYYTIDVSLQPANKYTEPLSGVGLSFSTTSGTAFGVISDFFGLPLFFPKFREEKHRYVNPFI